LLSLLSGKKKLNNQLYGEKAEELPCISILLAVYNEELVMEKKILSTFDTGYPLDKIEFIIGSDNSSDQSNAIIKKLAVSNQGLQLVEFQERTGKSQIINVLVEKAAHDLLILTDANVFFTRDTLYHLVKHFRNPDIAIIGGNILNSGLRKDGISVQEDSYLSRENRIKYREGLIWGAMMGAFGGCYALRKKYYTKVPSGYLVDDFYISMYALEQGGKCITELKAVCHEDVSNNIREEFRRKVRISTGNFRNLMRFFHLLFPVYSGKAFAFFSHKVLRWFGPFFILLILISNIFIFDLALFYKISLAGQIVLMAVPVLDMLLKYMHIHLRILRFITHFYFINAALLLGFFRFLGGFKSSFWQPTQRYQ
jgi:cellulose synthase/poly-beta-1,6-N-acetylglucosamine synthase-like glycosyltransferase